MPGAIADAVDDACWLLSRIMTDVFNVLQATYDKASDGFIIHTPNDTASKFWIGGAGQHGKVS